MKIILQHALVILAILYKIAAAETIIQSVRTHSVRRYFKLVGWVIIDIMFIVVFSFCWQAFYLTPFSRYSTCKIPINNNLNNNSLYFTEDIYYTLY